MSHFNVPVSEYMASPVRTIGADEQISAASQILREHALSSLAVVDAKGAPVGVISRTDLLTLGKLSPPRSGRVPMLELPARPVREVMHKGLLTISADSPLSAAAGVIVREHVHRVFVGDESKLVGVLSTKDIMRAVADRKVKSPISDYMSTPVKTLSTLDTIGRAAETLRDAHIAGLVVVDEDEQPVGLFTQVEALQAREMPPSTPVEDVMNYGLLCMSIKTPVYRAAGQGVATRARRVIAVDGRKVWGILTGIDFARVAA